MMLDPETGEPLREYGRWDWDEATGEMEWLPGIWEYDPATMAWVNRDAPAEDGDGDGIFAWVRNNLTWIIVGASALAVIAGVIIIIIVVRKKRAKNKNNDEDDDEDEDA
jgi:hypothetical protein